jgi:hypothetical protein
MISRTICLVLGAGASMPYGFCSGDSLKMEILNRIETEDQPFVKEVSEISYKTRREVILFKNTFRHSSLYSIDIFLQHRPDFIEIGKACISKILLHQENQHQGQLYNAGELKWYPYLLNKMRGNTLDDFKKNKIKFITYNYDRSLEIVLINFIHSTYNVNIAEASKIVNEMNIVHIHGSLGPLPGFTETTVPVIYGGDNYDYSMNYIRIIHEDVQEQLMRKARSFIQESSEIIFLGFAYNPQSVERLLKDIMIPDSKEIFGTVYGMTQAEINSVGMYFQHLGWPNSINHLQDRHTLSYLRETAPFDDFYIPKEKSGQS